MKYWIGQVLGVIAAAAGIAVPVMGKKWQMLAMSIANNVFCALNLIFLDAIGSGIFLFAVAASQALINLVHVLRDTKSRAAEKIIFAFLYLALGFYGLVTGPGYAPGINARNLLELLPITAAMMNMCFVFSRREITARIFVIACNFLWLIYYIIIGSSTLLGSVVAVIGGLIALRKDIQKAD